MADYPTVLEVAAYLGRDVDGDFAELTEAHLPVVVEFIKAYTRGRGFEDDPDIPDDIAAVILTATARLVTNPTGDQREQIGDYVRIPAVAGWSLPELAVLHRYRRRTA